MKKFLFLATVSMLSVVACTDQNLLEEGLITPIANDVEAVAVPTNRNNNPIIIVSFDKVAGHLIFEDNQGHKGHNITTSVWRNKHVIWEIKKGEDIKITNIYPKKESQNIFEGDGPIAQSDGSWKGRVQSKATGSELYNVDYNIGEDSYTDDPKLQVQN